jgi:hypothetical protein
MFQEYLGPKIAENILVSKRALLGTLQDALPSEMTRNFSQISWQTILRV